MNFVMEPSKDADNLKRIIKLLCTTGIRRPLDFEQVKSWLKQFNQGPEYTLALLIMRFLIYRTSDQLASSLKQSLKIATKHFAPESDQTNNFDWREALNGKSQEIDFYFGPIRHEYISPGKSGEIIARLIKLSLKIDSSALYYPDQFTKLKPNERYFLIDDGIFTGDQMSDFIKSNCNFMTSSSQAGVVVAIAHDKAINRFEEYHPNIPIFYGERLSNKCGFETLSKEWIEDGIWPYEQITPLDQYYEIVEKKAKFEKPEPLGYGKLGCLVAYQHGIPDDSLQLLWDKSETWTPLIAR